MLDLVLWFFLLGFTPLVLCTVWRLISRVAVYGVFGPPHGPDSWTGPWRPPYR